MSGKGTPQDKEPSIQEQYDNFAREERRRKKREKEEEEKRKQFEAEMLERQKRKGKVGRSPPLASVTAPGLSSESELDETKKRYREEVSPKTMEKRRKGSIEETSNVESNIELGEASNPCEGILMKCAALKKWLHRQQIDLKRVAASASDNARKLIEGIVDDLRKVELEKARLEGRVEERAEVVRMIRNEVLLVREGGTEERKKEREELMEEIKKEIRGKMGSSEVRTFAEVAAPKRPAIPKLSGVRGPVQPTPKVVMIRKDGEESEEVKKKLKELMDPCVEGIKVRRINKIKGGVMIETETEEDIETFLKSDKLIKEGLKVEKPKKKKPLIMVYDVPEEMKDGEIMFEVFDRNMEGSGMSDEEFRADFDIKHKYKDKNRERRNKKCSIVMEVNVKTRNWLMKKERLYLGWEACRMKDYVDVARCFKCQRFGHVAKFCKQEAMCWFCGGRHDYKDCEQPNDEPQCVNCKREGRVQDDHDCTWRQCPTYLRHAKRYYEMVGYDS